jgi:hypothetical protein
LVDHFKSYIKRREKLPYHMFNAYSWSCGGDPWGYGDAMLIVRQAAKDYGLVN